MFGGELHTSTTCGDKSCTVRVEAGEIGAKIEDCPILILGVKVTIIESLVDFFQAELKTIEGHKDICNCGCNVLDIKVCIFCTRAIEGEMMNPTPSSFTVVEAIQTGRHSLHIREAF